MLNHLKNYTHWYIYILGVFIFLPIIIDLKLSLGIVWLIFIQYAWLILSMVLKKYTLKDFLLTLCFSGGIVSLSFFIINGIEEIPFPEGAIIFHIEGIAQALTTFFIFSLPLVLYNHKQSTATEEKEIKLKTPPLKDQSQKQSHTYNAEKWEEASIEDLQSGSYEII